MRFKLKPQNDVQVLEVEGDLTIGEGDVALRDVLNKLFREGHSRIVLNLRQVKYLDSAGIGELIAGERAAKERGGAVKIAHPSPGASTVLKRFPQNFEIYESEEEAIESFP